MSTNASSELVRAFRGAWRQPGRLRIVHCLRAPAGGLFRHVRDLATAQAIAGHAVGIICDASNDDPLSAAHIEALKPRLALGIVRVPISREIGLSDVSAFIAARHFAEASGAHVLHGHGAKGGAYARLTARALRRSGHKIACCYTPHGGSLHYDPATLKGRIYAGLERRLVAFTDGLIFESAYAARVFAAHVGEPACQTRVIHNGIFPEEFVPRELDDDAADFLFIGELRRLKGVDVLLEALARVHRTWPARAVIVGSGPEAAEFQRLAQSLGLDGDARFLGSMPARDALALGHCIVTPSRAESLPYVVLEAASAGVPLIATHVGGIPEIVSGTDTRLVPPDDPDALAAAMVQTLLDPSAAEARAQRLRATVARRFTASAMASAVADFYAALRNR